MKIQIVLSICLIFTCFKLFAQKRDTINNGLALTPPMGWNSWNTFKKEPNETVIKQMADAIVKTGLKKVGYTYVNIDDFWSMGRDSTGEIIVDRSKFPGGMKALADYIHSKGLKAGIYTNIGTKANYATLASGGYYEHDMRVFAGWGYDYVKVDVNFAPVRTEEAYKEEFTEVANAILKSGRPMVFSLCNQGGRNYQNWAPYIGNSWRVGPDIDHTPKAVSQWEGVIYELDLAARHPEIAGPGHWNDADMMLIGVGSDNGRLKVLNYEEMKSHYSMWCIIASPLIIGNDLRAASKEVIQLLLNKEVIAVNQDALGKQGTLLYEQAPGLQVWSKQLYSHGKQRYAVVLFNRTGSGADIDLVFSRLATGGKCTLRDVWAHKNLGKFSEHASWQVPAHGVKMFIVN